MSNPTIKTKKGIHTLVEPGIIRFSLNENIEWSLEDAKESHAANMKLSNGGKYIVYMNLNRFIIPSNEAMAFISSKTVTDYRIAGCFVIENAAMILIGNLFNRFFKKATPSMMFKNEAEAFKWMRAEYKRATAEPSPHPAQ